MIILWSLASQHTLQVYTWIYFLLQASLWTYLCWISCLDFGSSFQHVDVEFAFCLLLYWQPRCCLLQKHEVGFPRPSSLARSMTEAPEDLCPFRNFVWCFPHSVLKICREHKMIPLWDGSRLKKPTTVLETLHEKREYGTSLLPSVRWGVWPAKETMQMLLLARTCRWAVVVFFYERT